MRVGNGQGSYCPEYNSYANSRQAYQEEAWLNRSDDFNGLQRRPIPQCRRHQQRYVDRDSSLYGDVQAVSAGQYDYDNLYNQRQQNRSLTDQFFSVIGSLARGIGEVAYQARPLLQTWAQIEMMKNGGIGGRYYGGGFGSGYGGGYYNQRPYNPWNSSYNRNLIAYNNNSGYYDNDPVWLKG